MHDNQWKHMRCPVTGIRPTQDVTPLAGYPAPSAAGTTLVIEPGCWRNNMVSPPAPGFPFNGSGLPHMDNASWVENVRELLGPPGQFWAGDGYVYYVPRPGEDLTRADVEMPVTQTLMQFTGTPGHVTITGDTDPSIAYTGSWQHFTDRHLGDDADDVHATQHVGDSATITFTGTGLDLLAETNGDGAAGDVTVRNAAGQVVSTGTATEQGPTRLAQQVVYSVSGLPKATYTVTVTKHADDAAWLVVDGYAALAEPLAAVHDVTVRGLTFAYATWAQPSTDGYVDNQAGMLWDPATRRPMRVPAAVAVHRGQNVQFTGNTFTHLGGAGLELADGTQNAVVTGNTVDDVSAGGVLAGEVDDYWLTDPRRMTSGITVSDNVVTNTGVEYHDTVAIWAGHGRHVTISHNYVAHTSYSGISLGWGWGWASSCDLQIEPPYSSPYCRRGTTYSGGNQILDNRISDVMHNLVDGGTIYTLGGQVPLDGVQPTVAGNVVSGATACFQMIYHDEGSSYWHTYHNIVYNTGCRWLGVWLHSSHDDAIGVDGDNWTSDPSGPLLAGSNTRYVAPVALTYPQWQPAAQAVAAQAGLEPAYRSLQPHPKLLNDTDDGPLFSSVPGDAQWHPSPFRGLGDIGDDVHYTTVNGAAVRLAFSGTGVRVYGERNGDQGTVEVFLDGKSKGLVDTSLPAGTPRQSAQVIYDSGALPRGAHVVEVVKRSGSYSTIDAFRLS